MAGYILELLKQILERSITKQGLNVTADEKQELSRLLDELLPSVLV